MNRAPDADRSIEGGSPWQTAVVIGGSLAGLLVAHVASRFFDRVIIFERGDLVAGMAPRRQVPQERHVHLLLQRGKAVLESMFPGLLSELEARGAVVADAGRDVKIFHRGRWRRRFESGISTHYCSRALIDCVVRERVTGNSRIELRHGARVLGLRQAATNPWITGVVVADSAGERDLAADFVFDCSGRGSQSAQWLRALGAEPVRVSEVVSRLSYGSRIYARAPEYDGDWKVLLVLPSVPASRRMGVISPIENDRWMVTTGGWLGDAPGGTEQEFLSYVRGLPHVAIHDVLRRAQPLEEVVLHKIPGGQRRHFEAVVNWPGRFLALGDAVCSLNPIYSQGMTVCALEVEVLRTQLESALRAGGNPEATRALQRAIAAQADVPWELARSEDLRFPEVEGQRDWRLRVAHLVGDVFADAAAVDPVVGKRLLRVTNLLDEPAVLSSGRLRARALVGAARARLEGTRP